MQDHTQLNALKLADALVLPVYELTHKFPIPCLQDS